MNGGGMGGGDMGEMGNVGGYGGGIFNTKIKCKITFRLW